MLTLVNKLNPDSFPNPTIYTNHPISDLQYKCPFLGNSTKALIFRLIIPHQTASYNYETLHNSQPLHPTLLVWSFHSHSPLTLPLCLPLRPEPLPRPRRLCMVRLPLYPEPPGSCRVARLGIHTGPHERSCSS